MIVFISVNCPALGQCFFKIDLHHGSISQFQRTRDWIPASRRAHWTPNSNPPIPLNVEPIVNMKTAHHAHRARWWAARARSQGTLLEPDRVFGGGGVFRSYQLRSSSNSPRCFFPSRPPSLRPRRIPRTRIGKPLIGLFQSLDLGTWDPLPGLIGNGSIDVLDLYPCFYSRYRVISIEGVSD